MGRLGARAGVPVEVRVQGWQVRAATEASAISQLVTEALAAIVRDHCPCGPWAHVHVGTEEAPDSGDVAAEIAQGQVLIRVQQPGKDRDGDSKFSSRWRHRADYRRFFGHRS
jgi:hypothetical protein